MIELIRELREWTFWMMEAGILTYVGLEYHYDKAKDDAKKQRRTKTTRKTTKGASGESIMEEQIEITEPVDEKKDGLH